MDFCDNLKKARQRVGLTQQQIANALGITKSTYCGYETGKRQPDIPKLRRLSLLLCTSVDEMLGLSGGESDYTVSPSEFEHIKRFRSLDAYGQRLVRMLLDEENARVRASLRETAFTSGEKNPFLLHIARESVTCEKGAYIGPDGFDVIPICADGLPPETAFALRVQGSSMEPRFAHHDILLISTKKPELGEIGVYMHNGAGIVRQAGFSELFYLNPALPPIVPDESIRAIGTVIGVLDADALI